MKPPPIHPNPRLDDFPTKGTRTMQTPGAPRDRSTDDDGDAFGPAPTGRAETVLYLVLIVVLGVLIGVDVWQRTCGLGVRC